jgi:hypothetical protein
MTLPLPRYIIAKPLASGATGFYFTVPTRYRKMGCIIPNEPLGSEIGSSVNTRRASDTAKGCPSARGLIMNG